MHAPFSAGQGLRRRRQKRLQARSRWLVHSSPGTPLCSCMPPGPAPERSGRHPCRMTNTKQVMWLTSCLAVRSHWAPIIPASYDALCIMCRDGIAIHMRNCVGGGCLIPMNAHRTHRRALVIFLTLKGFSQVDSMNTTL